MDGAALPQSPQSVGDVSVEAGDRPAASLRLAAALTVTVRVPIPGVRASRVDGDEDLRFARLPRAAVVGADHCAEGEESVELALVAAEQKLLVHSVKPGPRSL